MVDLRQHVYSRLGWNKHLKTSEIGKHFLQDFKRQTIYGRIKRDEIELTAEDIPSETSCKQDLEILE